MASHLHHWLSGKWEQQVFEGHLRPYQGCGSVQNEGTLLDCGMIHFYCGDDSRWLIA
jgi:hypothetical protein